MTEPAAVALVTGSARRIGASIVEKFHRAGCRVIIHYHHSRADADALTGRLNTERENSAVTLQADLTDASEVDRLASEANAAFGQIDYLINNASLFYPNSIEQSTQQQWDDLVDSNLRAAYFLSCALSSILRAQQGAVINLIDSHANSALQGYPIYSIAKGGLRTMTKALAKELAPQVRVNGVSPGAIIWPEHLLDDNDPDTQLARQKILAGIPMGCTGTPEQIADTVYFLATQATYVTGAVIKVDGGRSLWA